jgi:hypothetical protein
LEDGVRLSRLMKGNPSERNEEDEADDRESFPVRYYGEKWGIYLRAPNLWFDLMDQLGNRFAALGELADIRFGVKSGKDEFFFPRDVSGECFARFPAFHEFKQSSVLNASRLNLGVSSSSGAVKRVARYGRLKASTSNRRCTA